jgi:TonB family protein
LSAFETFSILSLLLTAGAASQAPEPGITRPRLLTKVDVSSTEEARKAGLDGTVELEVVIDKSGVPSDLKVTGSAGLGLDEAAIEAVRQWRFAPALKNGEPVRTTGTVQCNFRQMSRSSWYLTRAVFDTPSGASRPHVMHSEFPPPEGNKTSASVTLSMSTKGAGLRIFMSRKSGDSNLP